MVDCSDSFVPVAQGQLWPGGFCQGVVSAYPSTNSMQSQLCQVRNIVIMAVDSVQLNIFWQVRGAPKTRQIRERKTNQR